MEEYWPKIELDTRYATEGLVLSLPGRIALVLIEKWGVVAGKIKGEEDSAGRAILDVMPVEDVVKRAFDMAEQITAELERRQWIRPVDLTLEEVGQSLGRIEQARYMQYADKRSGATDKQKGS